MYAAFTATPRTGYHGSMIPEQLLSADVLGIFDDVASQNGFLNAPLGGLSSSRGNLPQGTTAVYIGGDYSQAAPVGPRLDLRGATLERAQAVEANRQSLGVKRAVTTIHELLHFNFSDEALSTALIAMTGSRSSEGGLLGASRHWDRELRKHCK